MKKYWDVRMGINDNTAKVEKLENNGEQNLVKENNVFNPNYKYVLDSDKNFGILISNSEFNEFNPSLLNIGELNIISETREVIAAIFDLEGFTDFCKQVDPQLSVPSFLNDFLNWLFNEIKNEVKAKKNKNDIALWSELPFFSKFLGDGILFLWNINSKEISNQLDDNGLKTHQEVQTLACNIVVSLDLISVSYKDYVKTKLSKKYVNPPPKLRCGIARGSVLSVGNGHDYVGPCINIASRLQKLNGLGFCFQKRGFDIEIGMDGAKKDYILKKVKIRGIGENELVYIKKDDFAELDDNDKKYFKAP